MMITSESDRGLGITVQISFLANGSNPFDGKIRLINEEALFTPFVFVPRSGFHSTKTAQPSKLVKWQITNSTLVSFFLEIVANAPVK
jgi:hypothetical protein